MHDASPNPLAHRDLKPHNILLTKDMRPVLMDLGSTAIARVSVRTHAEAQHLQDLAAERCSMPYRPPELFQVNSKCEVDERTDVWVSRAIDQQQAFNYVHVVVLEISPFVSALSPWAACSMQSASSSLPTTPSSRGGTRWLWRYSRQD